MIHGHGFYHHHHDCCPMGGEHCKHHCYCCGVDYCCKCGKEWGFRCYQPYYYKDPYYSIGSGFGNATSGNFGGAMMSAKNTSASCSHGH